MPLYSLEYNNLFYISKHAERDRIGKLYSEEIKKANCTFIAKFINEACTGYTEQSKLTKLPYIDLIEDFKQKK